MPFGRINSRGSGKPAADLFKQNLRRLGNVAGRNVNIISLLILLKDIYRFFPNFSFTSSIISMIFLVSH